MFICHICENSPYPGKTIGEAGIAQELESIILSIKKKSGEMIFNPKADTILEVSDTLIVMGHPETLSALKREAGETA